MSVLVSMLAYKAARVPTADRAREIARLIHCEGRSYAEVIDAFCPTAQESQAAVEMLSMGDSYFGEWR